MKQYIYGAVAGIFITIAAVMAYEMITMLKNYANTNNHVVGARSAKSPDGKWSVWISDEYSSSENKNYVSFAIYGSNGFEQVFTRFECFGGTAREGSIHWSPNGSIVTASIPMTTGYGQIRSRSEIEYNFSDDRLTATRIPE